MKIENPFLEEIKKLSQISKSVENKINTNARLKILTKTQASNLLESVYYINQALKILVE